MNVTSSLTISTTAASGTEDDTRIIIACALSSVAMVCIAAAMFYFRATVLRREKALAELRRRRVPTTSTTEKAELRGGSSSSSGGVRDGRSCSRPVSTASSTVLGGVRRSRPTSVVSLTRHQTYPPDPGRELRRGSLHAIPNGLGAPHIEPRVITTTTTASIPVAKPSSKRAASLTDTGMPRPPKLGPATRRASWSFENPVFDQWVPPLMKPSDKQDLIDQDDTGDDNIFMLEMEVIVDDIDQVLDENPATSDCPQRRLKSPRLSALTFGNPLYGQNADQPSMPTLHEREDSTTSSGSVEKATEKETTGSFTSCSKAMTDEPQSMEFSRPRAESFC